VAERAALESLLAPHLTEATAEVAEIARIEQGLPAYGVDITSENLPQEVGRDAQAISFTKGCYLGQETVARIDALGHVNRHLSRIAIDSESPPPRGAEFLSAGKTVGNVTSSCFSPRLGKSLALGYLRRGSHGPGTKMEIGGHAAEVVGPVA
jgi:tRNA-modifying protein YgfZ